MSNIPAFMKVDSTTCTILRIDPEEHEMGSQPGEYEELYTNVICALDRTQSISKNYGGGGRDMSIQGEADQQTFKLFVLSTEDIQSGDRIIVGDVEYKVDDVIEYTTNKEAIVMKW